MLLQAGDEHSRQRLCAGAVSQRCHANLTDKGRSSWPARKPRALEKLQQGQPVALSWSPSQSYRCRSARVVHPRRTGVFGADVSKLRSMPACRLRRTIRRIPRHKVKDVTALIRNNARRWQATRGDGRPEQYVAISPAAGTRRRQGRQKRLEQDSSAVAQKRFIRFPVVSRQRVGVKRQHLPRRTRGTEGNQKRGKSCGSKDRPVPK